MVIYILQNSDFVWGQNKRRYQFVTKPCWTETSVAQNNRLENVIELNGNEIGHESKKPIELSCSVVR
jgi:hypothetical protein